MIQFLYFVCIKYVQENPWAVQHFIGSVALVWEERKKGNMNWTLLEYLFSARIPVYGK